LAVSVLLFVDRDRFKDVNDDHAHRAGDAVLHEVAARIVRGQEYLCAGSAMYRKICGFVPLISDWKRA
jgi:GGDEF domain-containing protein